MSKMIGLDNFTRTGQFILAKCFKTRNQGRECIFLILTTFILEIGLITVWTAMAATFLAQDKFMRES